MAKYQHTSPENTSPVTTGRTIHWASRYDFFVSLVMLGRAAAFRRNTADLAHLQSGEVVLDVGCGTGDLTLEVEKQVGPNGKAVGIDAAPEVITYAQQIGDTPGESSRISCRACRGSVFCRSHL